ncbi:unnamed protein product [Cuscuta epithymum]|uniref:RNase H type-1 domain-containing protein n=1 Tax=Cuscuta epithymum TaxID=186058 RepID=A0AAV0EF81_9ASTE|nr:unnamed protein product [Cuscuta epithymum]
MSSFSRGDRLIWPLNHVYCFMATPNVYKLNICDSVLESSSNAAHEGGCQVTWTPKEAEALGLRKAAQWALEMGCHQALFETGSLVVILVVQVKFVTPVLILY